MKQKFLLTVLIASIAIGAIAQKNQKKTTAYAITGVEKGSQRWTEVRLIDLYTGEIVQTIYESGKDAPIVNARTQKPIVKKENENTDPQQARGTLRWSGNIDGNEITVIRYNTNEELTTVRPAQPTQPIGEQRVKKVFLVNRSMNCQRDKPFSTKSAACAFDKKHNRLYYTPMGINQLRYIDLKSKENKVCYFEDEAFGTVAGLHDTRNQITRMVIASDGDGYALTNNAEHLIKFTTNKKAVITDLGAIQDDPANGDNSIRSPRLYGGDMIADDKNNLYLISANRSVFKISIEKMTATFMGKIKGLPAGFTTNGAAVEKETTIILSSANSTMGYYKCDLKTMEAEKVSESEEVYTASDLANGNLLTEKKKNDKTEEELKTVSQEGRAGEISPELTVRYKLSVYPNPIKKGNDIYVRFNDFPAGRYQVQLFDMGGKLLSQESIGVGGKMQLHLLQMPASLSQGNYLVKVIGDANKERVLATERVVVQ